MNDRERIAFLYESIGVLESAMNVIAGMVDGEDSPMHDEPDQVEKIKSAWHLLDEVREKFDRESTKLLGYDRLN